MGLKDFLKYTSIHGLKYFVDPKLHWSEKLFWGCCVITSWFLSTQLALANLNAYIYNPIKFVVESTFIHWKTDFPSIVICESENSEKIEEASDFLWSPDHDFNLEEVLKEIAFFKGVGYYMQKFCTGADANINCPRNNFTYYASTVRSHCDEIVQNCTWNKEYFDCCQYFMPMETELGTCYGINSLQTKNPKNKKFSMANDRKSGPGKLIFNILVTANVFVLSDEEVPTLTTLNSDILYINGQQHYRRHISVKNMENDPQVKDVSVDSRRCKYPNENPSSVYKYYSYTACIVECRKKAQLATCGCTNFYSPNTPQKYHCDAKGLACLHENYNQLSVLKAKWSSRIGLFCDCLPSCEEQEIVFVSDDRTNVDENALALVEISMDILPNERNRRKIVRGSLDLVVSIGATVALFIGASMLSVVEAPYFVLRALFNLRNQRLQKNDSSRVPLIRRGNNNMEMPPVETDLAFDRNRIPGQRLYNGNTQRGLQRFNGDVASLGMNRRTVRERTEQRYLRRIQN